MGTLGKRARRRHRAQESLERGASHPEQGKDSNVDSEVDMEGDHEVLFPPKRHASRETVVLDPGLGQWLLAGVTVSGGKMQNSFRNPFRPVPVQSHAIWTVQRTGDLREAYGPSATGTTMVTMPSLFGRHYIFRNNIWRFIRQPDADI